MNSRVYLNNDGMYFGQPPRIEYFDYDEIGEDGTSKVYRFEFSNEVFESEIKDVFTEEGRDGCDVVIDLFAFYEGWNDLKGALEDMEIEFLYEIITLTKEQRFKKQESQYGEHRCVIIHGYHGTENIDEIDDLNEFEKAELADLNDNYKGVALEIPFDWEEEDFKFLRNRDEFEEYLEEYDNKLGMTPEEIDQLFYIQLLEKLLAEKSTTAWCGLLEEMTGQIANYENRIADCELAKKYHPNMKDYSEKDFMFAEDIERIPEDWIQFACACLKKMDKCGWNFKGFKVRSK